MYGSVITQKEWTAINEAHTHIWSAFACFNYRYSTHREKKSLVWICFSMMNLSFLKVNQKFRFLYHSISKLFYKSCMRKNLFLILKRGLLRKWIKIQRKNWIKISTIFSVYMFCDKCLNCHEVNELLCVSRKRTYRIFVFFFCSFVCFQYDDIVVAVIVSHFSTLRHTFIMLHPFEV